MSHVHTAFFPPLNDFHCLYLKIHLRVNCSQRATPILLCRIQQAHKYSTEFLYFDVRSTSKVDFDFIAQAVKGCSKVCELSGIWDNFPQQINDRLGKFCLVHLIWFYLLLEPVWMSEGEGHFLIYWNDRKSERFTNIQAPQWALCIDLMSAFVNKKQGVLQIFFIFPQTAVEMIHFKQHIEQSWFSHQYNISFGCCWFTSSVASALTCVCVSHCNCVDAVGLPFHLTGPVLSSLIQSIS